MRVPSSHWHPDNIFSNFLCVSRDEAVECEEEIQSGVNRKEARGRGLSSLQPLYCLACSLVLPVSHCASSLHVHILGKTIFLPVSLSPSKRFKPEPAPFHLHGSRQSPDTAGRTGSVGTRQEPLTYIWNEYVHCELHLIQLLTHCSRNHLEISEVPPLTGQQILQQWMERLKKHPIYSLITPAGGHKSGQGPLLSPLPERDLLQPACCLSSTLPLFSGFFSFTVVFFLPLTTFPLFNQCILSLHTRVSPRVKHPSLQQSFIVSKGTHTDTAVSRL